MSLAVDQAVSGLGAQLVNDRQEAIREIYVALGSTVRSYLQHLVGHDDADDILQRVFYEVWRHNTRYDRRLPRTWTFRLEPSRPGRSGACAASPSSLAEASDYGLCTLESLIVLQMGESGQEVRGRQRYVPDHGEST
jgi:hypothetical protein